MPGRSFALDTVRSGLHASHVVCGRNHRPLSRPAQGLGAFHATGPKERKTGSYTGESRLRRHQASNNIYSRRTRDRVSGRQRARRQFCGRAHASVSGRGRLRSCRTVQNATGPWTAQARNTHATAARSTGCRRTLVSPRSGAHTYARKRARMKKDAELPRRELT